MKPYPLGSEIPSSSLMMLGPHKNPARPAKDWYVLWRPPKRREQRDAYREIYEQGRLDPGEWEVYQQGLSRARAERLASNVTYVLSPRWYGENVPTKVGQGTPPKLNPPWTTRAIAQQWDDLQGLVGGDWMPVLSKPHASRKGELVATLDTLGCGAYGCVLETGDPDVVLKITTDGSEAEFATKILPAASATARAGFVHYLNSTKLESKHDRRPLYALWRESASDVGKIGSAKGITDRLLGRTRKSLLNLIGHSWEASQVALDTLLDAGDEGGGLYDGALASAEHWEADLGASPTAIADELFDLEPASDRLSAALSYFQSANEAMRGTELEAVGKALNDLLEHGIFVADVHEGNLGKVNGRWVITDPGNAIVLPSPWR